MIPRAGILSIDERQQMARGHPWSFVGVADTNIECKLKEEQLGSSTGGCSAERCSKGEHAASELTPEFNCSPLPPAIAAALAGRSIHRAQLAAMRWSIARFGFKGSATSA